ncbi:MAG: lipid-A-disaccharide synthase [Candidatus Omnitrophota bacterium]|jgi:lipid-A-disaccharide synthase
MAQKNILIICGEASGDLNAGNLTQAIKTIDSKISISAVGGETLRKAGANVFYDIKELSVLGFFDTLKKLPKFFNLKKLLLKKIKTEKFDLIILVDFSGFNLRFAKAVNKSIPVIYYVSPQVWASRSGRIGTIKKYVSKMIVLFKFEEDFYKKYGVSVDFVGHPLLDIVKPLMDKKEFLASLNFVENKTTISLLPGSRKGEIENILPIMLKTAKIILESQDAQFVIAKSIQVDWPIYRKIIDKCGVELKIVEGKTYDCLNICGFALVASGTATLETTIMQKAFAIIYKMNLLNYLLYRPQVKVPFIGIVNIIAGKKIVPEFIQFKATPQNIAYETLRLLKNHEELNAMQNSLSQLKLSLGSSGASVRAAKIILDFLK